MEFKDFTAGEDDNERRLDRILRIFFKDKSLGELYKLLRKGLIKVNHKKASPEQHIKTGDIISIAVFLFDIHENDSGKNLPVKNDKAPLTVIFENEHLLIIDKPYGRSVHGEKDGINRDVLEYLEVKQADKQKSLSFRPGPLHRLDSRTTGLLAFSKSLEGARWFSEGIKNHTIQKKYIGLAQGKLENQEEWKDRLTDNDTNEEEPGFYTVKTDKNGTLAETTARPLAYGKYKNLPVTLVEYKIKTGRKHQIRCQSAAHGHPLLGDTAYGGKPFKTGFVLRAIELIFPPDNPVGLPSIVKTGLTKEIIKLFRCCEIENPGL